MTHAYLTCSHLLSCILHIATMPPVPPPGRWPYRQLKRAGRLGDGTTAIAAKTGAVAAPAGKAKLAGGAPKAPPAGKRNPSPKKPSMWESSERSTSQEDEEGEDFPSHDAGSSGNSGSEGGWRAARRDRPDPADGLDQTPVAWLPAAGMVRQASEPLAPGAPALQPSGGDRWRAAPAAEPHRRPCRVSIDLGVMAHARRAFSSGRASASPQLSGSVCGASSGGAAASRGMHLQPAGVLKRRTREDEFDPLLSLMDNSEAQVSPFTAAAHVPPEGAWTPGSDGGGPWCAVQDPGADQLAQGLSRLAMRTLSLKRQCSRGGEALDPLEAALLMEVSDQQRGVHVFGCEQGCSEAWQARY